MNTKEILTKLVGFPTVSSTSNLPLIEWVEGYLANYGITAQRYTSNQPDKACLYAVIGDKDKNPIVLSGHTDVVPVAGQDWHTDPFVLTEKDGLLYGRGTCDMKGFLACALAMVPKMVEQPLKTPIGFALSYDEEIGCKGVLDIVREIGHSLPTPKAVWVGEPTSMKIVSQHKTCARFVTRVHGKEAHSSRTDIGVNALAYAARIAVFLENLAEECRINAKAGVFDPNYTTIHAGILHAGHQLNIIPNIAELAWEMRLLPSEHYSIYYDRVLRFCQECETEMRKKDDSLRIESFIENITEGLHEDKDSFALDYLRSLSGENETNAAPYATEAGHFQRAGAPTAIIGPGRIDEAHRPNEYVALSQLQSCEQMLARLIADCRA